MRVYETILLILDKNGPMTIPAICKEVNHILSKNREKALLPSHIKSIISRKKDLFQLNNGEISIVPDRVLCTLSATLEGFAGISRQIHVNFDRHRFTALEWRNQENSCSNSYFQPKSIGSLDEFKRELYALKVWDWNHSYSFEDGIVLDGKYWSVELKTLEKVYNSEGTQVFPANWGKLCKAIEKLTGAPFR